MHPDSPPSKAATPALLPAISSSMALSAPYQDAMRVGMGFNSFTQRLCIIDAVKQESTAEGPSPSVEIIVDNQGALWTGTFVDKISEVAEYLDVSGSCLIQSDAAGRRGKTLCFFDANFTESDINYFIQVRVTKSLVLAPELTEFNPIPNLPESEFTRVYGDSFISGFVEGGELNALVSVKLRDRSSSTMKAVKKQLENRFDFKNSESAARVPDGDDGIVVDGETTVSVSWKGGGLGGNKTPCSWTLDGLNKAVKEFPKHAMSHPVRISAILTGYTSLRSFYANRDKGGPLDYDNTGPYVCELLDAYMDYKNISRKIQQAMSEMEHGQVMLGERVETPELARASLEVKKSYETACRQAGRPLEPAADGEQSAHATTSTGAHAPPPYIPRDSERSCELPMAPNDLQPYKASIFGLERAQRDCRLEMTKIVREVNAVAQDPIVACDLSQVWRYLNPALFRALLPTVTSVGKQMAEKEVQQAEKVQETPANDMAVLKRASEELQRRYHEQGEHKKELENKAEALEAVRAKLNPHNGWCPVDVCQPVRIRAYTSKKSMDYDFHDKGATLSLHQYDSLYHPNQKFEIHSVGPKGFSIRHCASGRYVTTGHTGHMRVYMTMGEFPSVFTFECLRNEDGGPDGTVMIHLAEQDEYTLNVEGCAQHNGAKLVGWMGEKGDADRWYIKGFGDFST